MKKTLDLPPFESEDEEREFWGELDLSEHFEPQDFAPARFPDLKPTSRAISIRFPEYVLDAVKERANAMGFPIRA